MDRRSFLSSSFGGLSTILVGSSLSMLKFKDAYASQHVQSLRFRITDARKEMINHNASNDARCFFWIYKEDRFPADCPGPIIVAFEDEEIQVTVINELDEPHAFFIKGAVNTGPIAPGATKVFTFIAPKAGTYLYYDNLNEPVNRVMGLHGCLIVMPVSSVVGNKFTPYSNPTSSIQNLFNDFGGPHFPGLSWEEGDTNTNTHGFRQNVWLLHEASPILFAEVGSFQAGRNYPARDFIKAFTDDRYANTFNTGKLNRKPHFFTINGQSGFFAHHNPYITPWKRVGEPVLIRILNAGLYTHSLHIHANHIYLLAADNKQKNNLLWLDTYQAEPLQTIDWALPMKRPPDVPNMRGIGLPDSPMIGVNGKAVWPPIEEMSIFLPKQGDPLTARQSPLCYPMHDHIEIAQTAQGANYNMGMMSGLAFTGDRNIPAAMNFPDYPDHFDHAQVNQTMSSAPPIPSHHRALTFLEEEV